jgi:N-acetylglucosaminyl-diphospho-decaprenol L-rhamnosyltransferase
LSVAAVVVYTPGNDREPGPCLEALRPQVDDLVLVSNGPGPAPAVPNGVRVLENERKLGYASNMNKGIGATSTEFAIVANPDAEATPGAVSTLVDFASSHSRCGIAGPLVRYPDGSWQASRRRFPTVSGTLVRRTPIRYILKPEKRQRSHYMLDERPEEPVHADWMLTAFLLVRRKTFDELGGFDEGFHPLYGEDIDFCYRAAKAGWERWFVPQALVVHDYAAAIDHSFFTRRTLWEWRSIARFVRKHPERLRAL